ncbi:MAG: glutamine synthetase [Hamadaea sp.]|nr:glutamine synthetase [Hamadaea sp.]NUT20195.1 glutamine synthetase [Hamadaea sp.]
MVALSWVDNAGVTRAKTVPVQRLPQAAAWGVGFAAVRDYYGVDDTVAEDRRAEAPVGDVRLHPDLATVTPFAARSGWAWAAVDRFTQEGEPFAGDQRLFARRMVRRAAEQGLTLQMAFELEWFVAGPDGRPAGPGSAYAMARVLELADYARELVVCLEAQGVPVEQFHPESASGQLELAVGHTDPIAAADRILLVRDTVRAVSQRHGLSVSFAPVHTVGQAGNGLHLHVSVWNGETNLFAGGSGPHGVTPAGESILAGLLACLPALSALTAPGVLSRLRLVPRRWAGARHCWGRENREAGLRLITGATGEQRDAANIELKPCDSAANPYLVVGAVTALAAAYAERGLRLPPEVTRDPETMPEELRPPLLPGTVSAAVDHLLDCAELVEAMGPALLGAFVSVRRAEAARFADLPVEEILDRVRWTY